MAVATQTADTLIGGRVHLTQPDLGYRVSVDAVLLAAAVPAAAGQRALDVGCGVGGATLCLASRVTDVRIHGIDRDGSAVDCFRHNVAANGFEERVTCDVVDVVEGAPEQMRGAFDHVFSNPPYLPATRADTRPGAKASNPANIETVPLGAWLSFMADCTRPGGRMTLVHRADRLEELLAAIAMHAGEIKIVPIRPRAGEPAKRVILSARKGIGTPTVLGAGLVLHEDDGAYTAPARAILEDGASLDLP